MICACHRREEKAQAPSHGTFFFFFPSTHTTCSRSNVFKTSFFIQELSSKFTTSLNITLYLVIFWILSILFGTAMGKIREKQIILKLNPERTDWPWRRITSQKKLESIIFPSVASQVHLTYLCFLLSSSTCFFTSSSNLLVCSGMTRSTAEKTRSVRYQ